MKDLLRGPAPATGFSQTGHLQWQSWVYVGSCWLYVGYVWHMLALCWLYVGLCWIKLGEVGSCWFKLAQVGLKMRLCWLLNLRKSPEHTSQGLQKAKFLRLLIKNCSFWNTLNLQNIEKRHLFYRSVCNLHFLVSLNACLGLQVGSSSLQVGSCWLT